jgi:exodeoxyribonuclease-3
MRKHMLRILDLNLNGIRSAASKGFFEWLTMQQADIVCVQELKAQLADLTPCTARSGRVHRLLSCRGKERLQRRRHLFPQGTRPHRRRFRRCRIRCRRPLPAGRIRQVNGGFALPSFGSSSDERQQAKFRFLDRFRPQLERLAKDARRDEREVLLCGDWNIAHREIDLKNWKSNQKNSGFLPEERAWLSSVFDDLGWVDVHRRLQPEARRRGLHLVVQSRPGLGRKTSAGASITRSRLRASPPRRNARPYTRSAGSRITLP